jgi:hypothetical protein
MNNADRNLRVLLFREINRLEQGVSAGNVSRLPGAFVDAALHNANRTRAELAHTLQMDLELIDAILDGTLPDDEVDDRMLENIAEAIDYDTNLLRIMMGRAIVSGRIRTA